MTPVYKSRKFWIALLDIVISTITYFVTKYALPGVGNDILYVIGAWQPILMIWIYSIAMEDVALKSRCDCDILDTTREDD